ncbi:phage tail protein [Pseudomonas reactans]|uniref:Phage tail protein n=1 Tax=Pseudomonas reactans TaxID=117680 RepID=A0ABX2QTN3_9PSED|nr:phage tail assembly chaperone [Pseudomonas reactans]NWA40899.1 phage tail protein [Pseudomonas reactans]NWD94783.1 phage tail protein [Pseudomonas reactans]
MFASKSARGFYDPEIHTFMPSDALEISAERYSELLVGQSEGKVIDWNNDGFPTLAEPPLPSDEELIAAERIWRDAHLSPTDGIVARHRDEIESGGPTTLTPVQYSELQAYRRELRNWPQQTEFPLANHRPTIPSWLEAQPR